MLKGALFMIQTTLQIDGMMCGMCESHVNDAIRNAFSVQKVTSSHSKGETVILSEQPLDEALLRSTITATGYELQSIQSAPYEKKRTSLFGLFRKRCALFVRGRRPPYSWTKVPRGEYLCRHSCPL